MSKEQTLDKEPNKNVRMFTYPHLNKTEAVQPVKKVNNTFLYRINNLIWSILFSEKDFFFILMIKNLRNSLALESNWSFCS